MMVTVKYYGPLKDIAGKGEDRLDVRSVKDMIVQLKRSYGKSFDAQLRVSRILRNGESVAFLKGAGTPLNDGDTVMIVSPVAGG